MISGLGQRGAVVAIPQNSPSQQHEAHTGAYGASRRENRRPLSVTVGCYGIVAHGMKLPHTQTANARHHAVTSTQAVISKSLVAEKRIPALNHRVTRGASVVWKVARFLCRAWSPMEALHRKRLWELGFPPEPPFVRRGRPREHISLGGPTWRCCDACHGEPGHMGRGSCLKQP